MTTGTGAFVPPFPTISDEYRALNARLHRDNPNFGASGHKAAKAVMQLVADNGFRSVLDYGCGKGQLALALSGFDVREYDPAIPGKDGPPQPADLVVCMDVLEHIEPEHLDSVLGHIRSLTKRLFVCNVCTIASSKTLADGRNAHLIVQTGDWWRERVGRFFSIIGGRDAPASVVIVAKQEK